ncbi:MAG: response regulator transcription factor [Dehalococcoidia bacterium]|nr:response regulator transcription factor [Dehalococcoidia bacterium]
MTTIVLADDHKIVRQGIRVLLESEPDLSVIGEAANGTEAISLVNELKPDILVVDLKMPGLNGIEVTRRVTRACPGTRVVVLSMYDNEAYVVSALEAGARGYVRKEASADDLVCAIHAVVDGKRYLSSPLCEHKLEVYMHKTAGNSDIENFLDKR